MIRSLTIALTYASGPLPGLPVLTLSLHLAGLDVDGGVQAQGTVAMRGGRFCDFNPDEAAFRALCRAAEKAGFGSRTPRVEARTDTSDRGALVTLSVAHERGSTLLQLALLSSGFEGADAAALKRFFALLLQAAEVRDRSILADLSE